MQCSEMRLLVKKGDWIALSTAIPAAELVQRLPFGVAFALSKRIFLNPTWDLDIQTYALQIMQELRHHDPAAWNGNWKHDAVLGCFYDLQGWEPGEAFDAFYRALKRASPPPLELKVRMAADWCAPGVYGVKMDDDEAAAILEAVIEETPYIQAISALIQVYLGGKNSDKIPHLEELLKESEKQKLHLPSAFLDILDEYDPKLEEWLGEPFEHEICVLKSR